MTNKDIKKCVKGARTLDACENLNIRTHCDALGEHFSGLSCCLGLAIIATIFWIFEIDEAARPRLECKLMRYSMFRSALELRSPCLRKAIVRLDHETNRRLFECLYAIAASVADGSHYVE